MADLTRILNLLESFRGKSQVQAFLQSKKIPHSGTWETVRDNIKDGLSHDKITEAELVQLLEDIEEYGDQYVYLYDFARRDVPRLRNRADFERLLTRAEKHHAVLSRRSDSIAGSPPARTTASFGMKQISW